MKKEEKNISYIKYFYYIKKGHYSNKCSQDRKNKSKINIILAIFTLVIVAEKEVFETVETVRADKNSEDGKYPRTNLA